jgi:hypothetical protein
VISIRLDWVQTDIRARLPKKGKQHATNVSSRTVISERRKHVVLPLVPAACLCLHYYFRAKDAKNAVTGKSKFPQKFSS